MKFKKLLMGSLASAVLAASLAGCGGEAAATPTPAPVPTPAPSAGASAESGRTPDPEKTKIVIGTMGTFQDYIGFLPEKMAEWGYEVEFKIFDDVVTPDIALDEGSIDANFYQHKPYLDAYNDANGTELYACEPYLIASYDSIISNRYESLEELPDGASIAIADDASNMSANLHTLEFLGLIKLSEIPEGSYYTTFDVTENPKNFEFIPLPMNQRYAALDDVDAACTFFSGNAAEKYGFNILRVLDDDPEVAFPVIMAVDGKDKDAQWVRDLMEATASDDMREVMAGFNTPYEVWRILF